jgi:hypothetical protein
MIKICTGACGLISFIAIISSFSNIISEGIYRLIILVKIELAIIFK